MNLTGMTQTTDSDTDSDAEADSPSAPPSHPTLSFNFTENVNHPTNLKVFDRAADLIWNEQSVTDRLSHEVTSDPVSLAGPQFDHLFPCT
jgi:hypothetical protein